MYWSPVLAIGYLEISDESLHFINKGKELPQIYSLQRNVNYLDQTRRLRQPFVDFPLLV